MRTIRMASLAACLLCFGLATGACRADPAPGGGPSFDCNGPDLSVTEIQICANDELARYDRELAGLYQGRMKSAPPADRQTLQQDQRAWLRKRDACAGSVDCIKGAYLTKIYDLQTSSVPAPARSPAVTPMPRAAAGGDQAAQVNAAIALSDAAQTALSRARRTIADQRLLAAIDTQLAVKMNLRALNCIQNLNIAPGLPQQQLHDSYSGDPCFTKQDDDIAAWLGMRTVGYMLTLPALRTMPAAAPRSITDRAGSLALTFFSARSGVAVIQSATDVEVIDLARDVPISSRSRQDDQLTGISPNGRVYVTNANKGLRFYGSEDGVLLADSGLYSNATACAFPWLDPQTMLARDPKSYSTSVLYDFASGTYAPTDSALTNTSCFLPVPGADDTSVAFGGTVTRFRTSHEADGKPRIDVLQARQADGRTYFSRDSTALTAGGRQFAYVTDRHLGITDLSDLTTQVIDFGNYDVQNVWATEDPDRIIIRGVGKHEPRRHKSANGEAPLYVYAIKERTLSQVDTTTLQGQRFVYDPLLNALYVIKDAALVRVSNLNTGAPESLDAFAAEQTQAEEEAALPAYNTNILPSGVKVITVGGEDGNIAYMNPSPTASTSPAPTSSTPPMDALHQLAKVSSIEGAGIIDSDSGVQAAAAGVTMIRPNAAAKVVHVRIFPGRRRPLILVLTSRSPVIWEVDGSQGGQLVAVLLSGAGGSSVQGQGSAQVANIGSACAEGYGYASREMSPGYQALQKEVYDATGERISLFQGGTADTIFNAP